MGILDQLGKAVQNSSQWLKDYAGAYISLDPQSKQLVLKPKSTSFLCQQAVSKVEQLKSLKPDIEEGLIAEIEHQGIKAKVHFTPEMIFFKDDTVEGQLRLIDKPKFEADSFIYKTLIAGWSTILGGYIPEKALPDGIRIAGDKVYYKLPKSKLKLLSALFSKLDNGSALTLELIKSELMIKSEISIDWSDLNLKTLGEVFNITGSKS